ncbi:MAG: hypothetical protein HXY25_04450 [Alphaproteobacteria bacterium]|nr:hypothetical protein [Alphaproteobacteria bacterium]
MIERPIPLAVVGMLIAQSAAVLFWAGALGARVGSLEKDIGAVTLLVERTARLEAQMDGLEAALARIERKLDDRQPAPAP